MSFLSLEFILFFFVVLGLYWFVFKDKQKRQWLLSLSSLLFISTHSYSLVLILILSSFANISGLKRVMTLSTNKVRWLIFLLFLNFSVVAFSGTTILKNAGLLSIVGLSFYYFKIHSLYLDAYNDYFDQNIKWIDYVAYLSFFPTTLSGPIMSFSYFHANAGWFSSRVSYDEVSSSALLFIRGMAKKILISTFLFSGISSIVNQNGEVGRGDLCLLFICNFFYITSDLSAYTDMARGVSGLLGFNVKENFNFSYLAKDIGDFWKRHHISVSDWFRQYVFFPFWVEASTFTSSKLAGALALFLTFVASGLWHSFSVSGLLFAALHFLAFIFLQHSKISIFYKLFNFIIMFFVISVTFWGLTFPLGFILKAFNGHALFSIEIETRFYVQMFGVIAFFILIDSLNSWLEIKRERITNPGVYFSHSVLLILSFIFWDPKAVEFLYFNF